MEKKLTGFVVGAGLMGSTHLQGYLADDRVNILGIIDSDERKAGKLAQEAGCRYFKSVEEAYAFQHADFADVCLPSFLHRNAVISCLENGSHVIVEKPFSIELDDSEEMILASENLGKRLMVAHVCRFMPQYFFAKSVIDSGELGRPLAFYACRESDSPAWSWNNWFQDRKKSGGTLLDLSIHDIDIANWFLGRPEFCKAVLSTKADMKGFDYVSSSIQYEKGGQATIVASHLMPKGYPFVSSFRLLLENGCIEWNTGVFDRGILGITGPDGTRLVDVAKVYPVENERPYEIEVKSFISCLISGNDFVIQPEDAFLAVKTVRDLYENCDELSISN